MILFFYWVFYVVNCRVFFYRGLAAWPNKESLGLLIPNPGVVPFAEISCSCFKEWCATLSLRDCRRLTAAFHFLYRYLFEVKKSHTFWLFSGQKEEFFNGMKKCKWNGGWTSFHVQCKKDNNGVKEGWLLRGDELCVCCEREYCLFWNYKSRFDSRMGFVGRMQRMAGGWSEWSLEVVWCLLFQCVRSRDNKNSSGGSAVALPPKCSFKARRPAGIALTDAMDDQQC